MKKQQLSLINALCSIGVAVLVIFIGVFLSLPHFDKSDPIIFERILNGEYSSVVYEEREYLPFAPCSPRERTAYLGYVGEDEADEIYSYKDYDTDEWLVSYLNSGMMADCMLIKEKNTTNIPDGLSSEYEWWSADLSQITFDGKTIGDTLEQAELAKYTPKTNLSSEYSHNYEEWRLTIADDKITEIMATFGEIEISINGMAARNFASQGQARTAALSIKLAEREIFKAETGEYPVLLLDDVLSELDITRQEFVLNRISGGQTLITCCEDEDISRRTGGRVFSVRDGRIR